MEKLNLTIANEAGDQDTTDSGEVIERVFLGKTGDGASVYDRLNSHFHSEGGLTPDLLRSALGVIDTEGQVFVKEQVNFDRPIGESTCVNVGPEDDVVMVYRKGRSGQSPMVKNREAEPCSSLVAILKQDSSLPEAGAYELITSFIGRESSREPWDPNISTEEELQKSQEFWQSHALIYDDDLIDWEKTKAFEFMSAPAKRAELIRQKTFFAGIFLNPDELYGKVRPTLEKPIEHPHVTTNFKPDATQLNLEQIGSGAKIYAVGYGNDGKNEGLLVKVEAEDPVVQAACNALETPHITLSISEKGQAKDTAFLDFRPLEEPIELTGDYGLFIQGKVILDTADLDK